MLSDSVSGNGVKELYLFIFKILLSNKLLEELKKRTIVSDDCTYEQKIAQWSMGKEPLIEDFSDKRAKKDRTKEALVQRVK